MTLPCVERLFPPSFTDSLTLAKAVDQGYWTANVCNEGQRGHSAGLWSF